LRFGDGVDGRQPEPGTGLVVRYRIGSGQAGNVGADAIQRVVAGGDLATALVGVRNPSPAAGGIDPEPLDHVRLAAPVAFRTQERAVTEDDYARVAERHPEVQRAVATSRWTGSWHTMFVTVERGDRRPVDSVFAAELRAFLDPFRLAGYDLEIDSPRWVSLDIALTVCVAPGYVRATVRQALVEVFSAAELPDGRRGFFHPDNFTFGQPVYLSQVVATAMGLPGVSWVDTDDSVGKPNRFQRWGKAPHGEIAAGRIAFGRLEIARLESDPSQPEHGQIEFFMEGGL
jgi:predicted phage baseplate assembly protein